MLLVAAVLASAGCAAAKVPAAGTGGSPPVVSAVTPAPGAPGTIGRGARIAVFPVQNVSGNAASSREVTEDLKKSLAARTVSLQDDPPLDRFLEKRRVRFTGGLTRELGGAFRSELGVDAVLIVSLDLYEAAAPPKIGITARLVSTGEETAILWADGTFLSGNGSPGLLGLGLVTDPGVLKARALDAIAGSLEGYLAGRKKAPRGGDAPEAGGGPGYRSKHLPRGLYRQPDVRMIPGQNPVKVAVLPFLDRSARPYAGELMANHFLRELVRWSSVEVVEPGVVRLALLRSRLIMEGGLSFPQADLLGELLGVDYVVTGEVMDYQDPQGYEGTPYAEFSVYVIDVKRRQVVWMSSSYNRGDDRVVLFDWGKTYTAGAMVSEMVRAVTDRFLR